MDYLKTRSGGNGSKKWQNEDLTPFYFKKGAFAVTFSLNGGKYA
jgi:hypothetical protein